MTSHLRAVPDEGTHEAQIEAAMQECRRLWSVLGAQMLTLETRIGRDQDGAYDKARECERTAIALEGAYDRLAHLVDS